MAETRPISRADLEQGMEGPGVYCLRSLPRSNWSDDPDLRDLQEVRQRLYLELVDKVGACGLAAVDEEGVVGFVTFMPKTTARRLGFYTLPGDDGLARTLVVACIHVTPTKRGCGIGSTLIQGVKVWAADHGYFAIEAIGEGKPQYGWHASAPFLASGFEVVREQWHGSWCGQVMKCAVDT
jgi:GNAT superfamily N-acetyltransferase